MSAGRCAGNPQTPGVIRHRAELLKEKHVSNAPHILAAAQQLHEVAKTYPMTAKDADTAKEAGIFAGAVFVVGLVVSALRGGSRKPAAGRN
jgi:hypothetical protein